MRHNARSQSIAWFQDKYKSGMLELRPPFQRKPVWTAKQRCALIESILLEIPVPEVYVQVVQTADGPEEFGVVDGQQRLRTILQFIGIEHTNDQIAEEDNNNFELDSLPDTSALQGLSFAAMKDDARKKFYGYEICVRYLYTEDIKVVEDVFKRLNKFSMPLKAQELRNATYHGPFAKLSEALADDEYWALNRIVTPAAIRRMSDIEFMSDLLIGIMHGPQSGAGKTLDDYYEQYEQFEDEFPDQTRITRLFKKTRESIATLFPGIEEVPRWGNKADFYSLFVALGNQLETQDITDEDGLRDELVDFATEVSARLEDSSKKVTDAVRRYAGGIEKGVSDKGRRMDRHESLVEIITPYLGKKKIKVTVKKAPVPRKKKAPVAKK